MLLDGQDLISVTYKISSQTETEPIPLPKSSYGVFSTNNGLEIFWTATENIPEYSMALEILAIDKFYLVGDSSGMIDKTVTKIEIEENPAILVEQEGLAKGSVSSVGYTASMITNTGTVAATATASFGFSFMYISKLIQFLEFVSYFPLFNTDFGPKLGNFFFELSEIMNSDFIPNFNEYLFGTRKYADGYFWNGKVSQNGMLDWIYVNAANNFMIFLLVLLVSCIINIRVFYLKCKYENIQESRSKNSKSEKPDIHTLESEKDMPMEAPRAKISVNSPERTNNSEKLNQENSLKNQTENTA
jgi:hypothetical protein